jgi:hypothetical protein
MKRQHSTTPTPDRILAAADRIVLRDGVRRLTLEVVAGNRRQNRQHLLGGWIGVGPYRGRLYIYSASKAMLNMYRRSLAAPGSLRRRLPCRGVLVNGIGRRTYS